MPHEENKPKIYIPFELLPESRNWAIGKVYRTRVIFRQLSTDEKGASFEVIDVISLEANPDKKPRYLMSEDGVLKA